MKNNNQNSLAIFETYKIRRVYDEEKEIWYFSVIDIVAALTGQYDFKKAKSYWSTLKDRLKKEGSELVTKCDQLKMQSADGKFYHTDHMSEEELIFSALAELSTRRIAETEKTKDLEANKIPAKKGGKIAKDARIALEEKIGKSVITGENFLPKIAKKKKYVSALGH